MAGPSSSTNFREKMEDLLSGGVLPPFVHKKEKDKDGKDKDGKQARSSTSVKDKSRVLEGEMGRLTYDTARLKKCKESIRDATELLEVERSRIRSAEVITTDALAFLQNRENRVAIMQTLLHVDNLMRGEMPGEPEEHR